MSSDEDSLSDLAAFEAALASLAPRADRLNRDRLMFRAGQANVVAPPIASHAAGPPRWAWPTAFAAMTTVAASLLVALVTRPGPQVVQQVLPVRPESSQPPRPEPSIGEAEPAAIAGKERAESPTLWLFGPLVAARSDGGRLPRDDAGLLRAGSAWWPEKVRPDGAEATQTPVGSDAEECSPASPPAPYRELLERLLKDIGPDAPRG